MATSRQGPDDYLLTAVELHNVPQPHSTVEVESSDQMDWDMPDTPASVSSTQYSEVTSPSGDNDHEGGVPSFASEVEVSSHDDGGGMQFSLRYNAESGKVEVGAGAKQLWNSLTETARKEIISKFQQKAASRTEDGVNDLQKYKTDIEAYMNKDVQKIPVKTLRKIIPEMRIFCYMNESQYIGKKKLKHLWDKESQPKDWPRDVPFTDPNNGDRNGPKTTDPKRGKPGKEVLMKMFEFLKKKYYTLNVKQPMEEECTSAYTPTPATVYSTMPQPIFESKPSGLTDAESTEAVVLAFSEMPGPTDLPFTMVPESTLASVAVQQAPASAPASAPAPAPAPPPAPAPALQVPAPAQQVKPHDSTTSDVIDSMYERLGSKFNQVAMLATHQQEAQTLLHNLICALQEMYTCDKSRFLRLGHQVEGILDHVLFFSKTQENWCDFIKECRKIMEEIDPVKAEPQSPPPQKETEIKIYNVELHTTNNPFETMKSELPLKGFTPTFPDLLGEVPVDDDLKKEVKLEQWRNAQQKGQESQQQGGVDEGLGLGIQLRTGSGSGNAALQTVIEERSLQELMFVDGEDGKRDDELKVQDQTLCDQNFKDSTQAQYLVLADMLKQALNTTDPMWNQSADETTEDDVLDGVLDMEAIYNAKSPQPSTTLQIGDASPTLQPQSPGLNATSFVANQLDPMVTAGQHLQSVPSSTATVRREVTPNNPGIDPDLLMELRDQLDPGSFEAMLRGENIVHVERPNGQIITVNTAANPVVMVKEPQPPAAQSIVAYQQPVAVSTGNGHVVADSLGLQGQEGVPMQAEQMASPGQIPLVVEQFEMDLDDL